MVYYPVFWLWGKLVFCFGLFFGCCWDGLNWFLDYAGMLGYVGWDSSGMVLFMAGAFFGGAK